jgi:predicted GH43/DUF377 family glycosyl hydrolase
MKLTKYERNPIIAPRSNIGWEQNGTFNPGTAVEGEKIHVLYRAVDAKRISRLGYAQTLDGKNVEHRSDEPVMTPSADWEMFGCEDPRITKIDGDGTFYVTYTAFSRRGPRIALAATKDFKHFEKYGLVGPDLDDKDFVIFPEKINGKIAILHRLKMRVQLAYFDSIESLAKSQDYWSSYVTHLKDYEVLRSRFSWEKKKVGIGPPPIKTERGWLVIYHGVSADRVYRAGALLLDLNDPKKVVARTKNPILEPEHEFEKKGVVPNVVFPDGAIVRDGELMTHYGGADTVCCVASVQLDSFLDYLEKSSVEN